MATVVDVVERTVAVVVEIEVATVVTGTVVAEPVLTDDGFPLAGLLAPQALTANAATAPHATNLHGRR